MMLTDGAAEADSAAPAAVAGPASVDYSHIPFIPRRWLWQDVIPVGNPVMLAAAGGTGKGLLTCLVIARTVLGLPFPGEDQSARRAPGRVVHIAGSEDDPFEDLAPRFRAAIAAAVAEFGLDPELAGEQGAIRLIHDLSEWPDGSPFELPADMGRLAAEVGKLNKLDRLNRPPSHPDYAGPGPSVALVVLDPFADMLGQKDTISSVKGARAVLKPIKLVTRQLDVGVVIVHHLTKDGKVSGSPAVLDALRLAFVIERDTTDETVRVITNVKSNIAGTQPQRYRIAGHGPATRAEFIDAADARTERVTRAAERAAEAPAAAPASAPLPGSVRARMAAYGAPGEAGPFHLARMTRPRGAVGRSGDVRAVLGTDYPTRALAWSAVLADCGQLLDRHPAPSNPLAEVAGLARPDGSRVTYCVQPA